MLQCAVSDAGIVTGLVCHASEFFYFSRDYYNACLFGTTRPLDAVWICTTHEIPLVSLHLRIGKNGFLFSNGFIGVIAYSFLPDLLIAILIAHLFLNH
jgi:hypothetical protein